MSIKLPGPDKIARRSVGCRSLIYTIHRSLTEFAGKLKEISLICAGVKEISLICATNFLFLTLIEVIQMHLNEYRFGATPVSDFHVSALESRCDRVKLCF